MTVLDTAWGPISVSYISDGPKGAAGEIHIAHHGALTGRQKVLGEIRATFPRVEELELNDTFWVLKAPAYSVAATAEAIAEAIASRAAKGEPADAPAEMDAVSTVSTPRRRPRGDRYVNNPRRR